jgi:hypothetical protein
MRGFNLKNSRDGYIAPFRSNAVQFSNSCHQKCWLSGIFVVFIAAYYVVTTIMSVHSIMLTTIQNGRSSNSLVLRQRKSRMSFTLSSMEGIRLQLVHMAVPNDLHNNNNNNVDDDDDPSSSLLLPLLKLASTHFSSQALYTAVRLKIPDILGDDHLSIDEISISIGDKCNHDALRRTMRLLVTIDIVEERHVVLKGYTSQATYSLTRLGTTLRQGSTEIPTMASCILHWMERPLWDAWLELPPFIADGKASSGYPFERANNGISSDYWYNAQDHPESLQHANDFVKLVHKAEIEAVINGFDWSTLRGKRLVDIGGHHGQLIGAIADKEPDIECSCLDLPQVIACAPIDPNRRVTLVPGNIFEPTTIPLCDAILMKHFLDRCMWDDDETIKILKSCYGALHDKNGIVVIGEAVLPDYGKINADNSLELSMDALYMLVGREGQRTETEWKRLAKASGFEIDRIVATNVPSSSLIILKKL